ncbi:MAG: AAA family ATPase [Anaerolineales bacterium]
MRIKSIQLSWFRGAADTVTLEPNGKSMVIYGENGSGKSSFVDSVEYILNNGRINHLAHEYSGKHQEKSIHNTHKPQGEKTETLIKFADNSELRTEIKQNGTSTSIGAEMIAINTWSYRSTILRQDEVATFVHDTKGDKYSALLPLLGLDELVTTAENLKLLIKSIETNSKLKEIKAVLKDAETKRKEIFGTASDDQILKKISELHAQYCPNEPKATDPFSQCNETDQAIQAKSSQVTPEYDRYRLLQNISQLKLKENVSSVRLANSKIADSVEPLIIERLDVLQSTHTYVEQLNQEKEVPCPACGRSIAVDSFQSHIKSEQNRLQKIIDINNSRKTAIDTLCDTLKSFKTSIKRNELKSWQSELAHGDLSKNLVYIGELSVETIRSSCDEENLILLENLLLPLIEAANSASKNAPPDTQKLLADKKVIDGGKIVISAMEKASNVLSITTIMSFLNSIEQNIRAEIRSHTETVIKEISVDIQKMWGILHPGNTIKEVRLYTHPDEDKAIDISLEFFGIEQPSPRMTLSEGYRNSLGLSIFLSMAKRVSNTDRPLFLDDVIVSLDRNHRGMVAELLKKEFSERQVVIFTHDRDWYTELRHQLDNKNWTFKALLPYETPDKGIRWSHKTTTFDDARTHNLTRPDSAGNDARKIMDIELSLIAEKLQIKFPYLRAEKNDKRMAHDFLERISGSGKKCFEKKENGQYVIHKEAIEAFVQADKLIVTWANHASHTFDVVQSEAKMLIDACEKALEFFMCKSCGENIWFADAEKKEWVQCQCGELRWRYGKES